MDLKPELKGFDTIAGGILQPFEILQKDLVWRMNTIKMNKAFIILGIGIGIGISTGWGMDPHHHQHFSRIYFFATFSFLFLKITC